MLHFTELFSDLQKVTYLIRCFTISIKSTSISVISISYFDITLMEFTIRHIYFNGVVENLLSECLLITRFPTQ